MHFTFPVFEVIKEFCICVVSFLQKDSILIILFLVLPQFIKRSNYRIDVKLQKFHCIVCSLVMYFKKFFDDDGCPWVSLSFVVVWCVAAVFNCLMMFSIVRIAGYSPTVFIYKFKFLAFVSFYDWFFVSFTSAVLSK